MLAVLFVLAVVLLLLSWGRQALWSWRLALCYPPRSTPEDPDTIWPEAAIVLPLRGADPALTACLRGLCAQDYPGFTIHIVVDSEADPAWEVLRLVLEDTPEGRLRTSVLRTPHSTCSLKVSSLLQALDDLSPTCGVVALIDADVVPPANWLRLLVRPLLDPTVGASTGIRWYHTHSVAWGSLVRHIWGAGAATQMVALGMPWGGSMAIPTALVRDPRLRSRWAGCFVEDVSLAGYLGDRRLRLAAVPALSMINDEAVSLAGCWRFIRRQMFSVWLHHPARWNVLLTGLAMSLSLPVTLLVAWLAWRQGEAVLAWTVVGGTLGAILVAGLGLVWIDGYFYSISPVDNPLATLRWRHIPCLLLTMLLYPAALVSACLLREIDWRGVRYRVGPGERIQLIEYTPCTRPVSKTSPTHSIL